MTNTSSPGHAFYERQVAALQANDIDAIVRQYTDDARVVGFDFQVQGSDAIRTHFTNYMARLGFVRLVSTDKFTETPDAIFFEATVNVQGGQARVYDVFVLRDGRATHHFTGLLGFTPESAPQNPTEVPA
ncbi:nuclear transport factor 2 family protein [Deinococcus yavapaiensis]|uniref:SnoaL-like protein n=1 Tax=Deinococcus yavapaiensis KR-236 TaxID=694435 RepID=A0A318S8F4_9DEIO|nr:nuclear transport factor 2 family protein [Deinococcus yavapaiensis]PYE54805.1 SnoaL-like protein [Deinococcus yavapaiensis KR-236]